MMSKLSAFCLGAVCGTVLWWSSPFIFLTVEPWDASGAGYSVLFISLLGATGIINALLFRQYVSGYIGTALGQCAFLISKQDGPLIGVGVLLIWLITLPNLIAGFLTCLALSRWRNKESFKSRDSRDNQGVE